MKHKGLHVTGLSCPLETPLTLAAQTEGSVEVIRTLCLGGAHIDFRARDGMTALHKAACARHCLALTVRCQTPPSPEPSPSLQCSPSRLNPVNCPRPTLPRPSSLMTPQGHLIYPLPLISPPGCPLPRPHGDATSALSSDSSLFPICSFSSLSSLDLLKIVFSSCPKYKAPFHRLTNTQPPLSLLPWTLRPSADPWGVPTLQLIITQSFPPEGPKEITLPVLS